MVPKQRGVGGRSRMLPRHERRAPASATTDAHLAEARRVARRFVAARWPELAAVAPVAYAAQRRSLSPELLARLGLSEADLAGHERCDEYTFTFAGEQREAGDEATPLVVNVTVDAQHRIVRKSVSR